MFREVLVGGSRNLETRVDENFRYALSMCAVLGMGREIK